MRELTWDVFEECVAVCGNCALCAGIRHKVPGQGCRTAPLMLIGEGPGQVEDEQGLAFVGPAGQLLTRMLAAIGLSREEVYICNVVKCRPPHNRTPSPEEAAACLPLLRMQTALIRPRVILLLGATAARTVLGPGTSITRVRGLWTERRGVSILATYHPSALLRDPAKKREAWADLQTLRARLDELGLYPAAPGQEPPRDETGASGR